MQLKKIILLSHKLPSVPDREVAECPLVGKRCNINTYNMAEGCFFHLFFIFYIFIYQLL